MSVFTDQTHTLIPDTTSVSIMWSPMTPSPGMGYTATVLFYSLASLEENFITLSVARVNKDLVSWFKLGDRFLHVFQNYGQEWSHNVKTVPNSNVDASFEHVPALYSGLWNPHYPLRNVPLLFLFWAMEEIHGDSRAEEEK